MQRFFKMIMDRNVLLLSASYFCVNYAFWLLTDWLCLYLFQERDMSALKGGALAALPPIGAAVGAWLGGGCAGRPALRFGPRWGYRLVPLIDADHVLTDPVFARLDAGPDEIVA